MKNILKNYRRRLLNLSSSNRSLVLLRLSKEQHLDVQELDFLLDKPAFGIVQQVISGKKKIALCPFADSRQSAVTPVSRRLRNIRRRAEMIFEERGSKELYVGWPFVHGAFPDGTVVRCPLLFFPVRLQVNAAQEWEMLPDDAQQPQFNQSFLLAYAHYMGTPPAEPLAELDLQTLSNDPLAFRTAIYELLKEHQLKVHAGTELFADKLKNYRDYKKADFETTVKPGMLHLEQEAVLGIFPQAASYLLSDYDELLEREDLQEMEDLFTFADTSHTSKLAQQTFTSMPMDASQEAALQAVKEGKSLVVQGPPGTGKSQLICNLVSDFTARGKKVLVVCQKRAALDVVHQRLSSKGLGHFAALVHDINTDRRIIYNQLAHQIEQVENYKQQNLALNSIYTDRVFLEVCRGINQSTQRLEAFKHALFDTSHCGWSAKELYLRSNPRVPVIALGQLYKNFTAETVAALLPRLRQYLQQAAVFEQDSFLLKNRYSLQGWNWGQRQELEELILQLPAQHRELQQDLEKRSGFSFTISRLPALTAAQPVLAQLHTLLREEEVAETLHILLEKQPKTGAIKQQLKELKELYLVCPPPDATIPTAQLPAVSAALAKYGKQQGNLLKGIGWAFSREKKVLKQALATYNWELNETDAGKLQRRLELHEQALHLMQLLNPYLSFTLKIEDHPTPVLHKLEQAEKALKAQKLLLQLHTQEVLHQDLLLKVSLKEHLETLEQNITAAREIYDAWLNALPETQIRKLISEEAYAGKLVEALQQHFEHLVAYDSLYASFVAAERSVIKLLLAQTETTVAAGEEIFLNSIYLSWLQELEQQHPELRMPSNGELEREEEELQRLLKEKEKLSEEMVLSKLREHTYRNMEYNRLGNAVTYRRLLAQVSKKRSLYPIRKLFSLFDGEMLDLVPCWLASPETVSAVMPQQECFDLVIFDEASQCFAETGIPSMVRGRQVMVAGDAQQLKPSDLYRARWNSDEEETEELTAESLLELCGLHLPQTMLTQHYRSRYPELIDFSNRHFYNHKLEQIPDFVDVTSGQPAISFVHVAGVWKDNANVPEAEAVVALVLEQLAAGEEQVGVITFNYNQQMLVHDLLEDTLRQQDRELPPTVLVKNIENIQGDEKEVIILSVGYAPDENGRLKMLFGSLNAAGGENRLNVAITRAKQKIFVVSSVLPEQLQVEATLHPGPKLLKAYLAYAQQVSQGKFDFKPRQLFVPTNTTLLKEMLQVQNGHQTHTAMQPELPFADLTLVQHRQYKGVVLTDDDLYFNQLSVRQSHADVPQLLQQRRWPYLKIYSRQYWASPDAVKERLQAAHPVPSPL